MRPREKMKNIGKQLRRRHDRTRGFTMVETVVVLGVILVTTAISLPSFLRSYQYYQVTDAASRMVNVVKFTRYEAIRLNRSVPPPVGFVIGPAAGGVTTVWTDSNGNGAVDPGERQFIFSTNVTLVAAGNVPNVAGLTAAAGVGPLIPLSNTNDARQFDPRGAVNPLPAGALVSYVSNTAVQSAGYRAVILLPSGSMQLWQADGNGNWTFLH